MKLLLIFPILLFTATGCSDLKSNIPPSLNETKPLKQIIDSLKINTSKIYLLIDKSEYKLSVMSGDSTLIKSYAVVFGPDPVNDKLRQGDGCTPEGWFSIQSKYPHKSWNKFMWLDYPTADSWRKHNAAVVLKKIPSNSDIGGEIGIHGVPKNTDSMIDSKRNWTLGCISLKNNDVDEVYSCVKTGTKVYIKK